MPKKATVVNHEVDPDTIVSLEFDTINERPFFGQVSDDELMYIWLKVFNRRKEELFGTTSTKTLTRKVRATFKLNDPIKLHEVFEGPEFAYEKCLDDGSTERITGKILGYGIAKPAQIGELTNVTVKTNFRVDSSGVINWLKLYGVVQPKHEFLENPNTGLKSDILNVEVLLKRHIEEYLPMYGQKVQVNYPGIPRTCNRCYRTGHLRRDCNNKKREWVVFIIDLLEEGNIRKDMIGSWSNAITRHLNANANPRDPKDDDEPRQRQAQATQAQV
jgi:hypothetical protein